MSIPFNANQEVCNQRSGVYAIVNIVTRKFYIGSAVKLNSRKSLHLNQLRKGKHHSKYLQSSYNKHGEDVFVFKVLEYVENKNNLLKIEQKYLDIYFHTGITYNISPIAGSSLGVKRSEETKQKLSKAHTGKIRSDEIRKKMSKPIIQLDKNNNFVVRFNSMIEAAKETGINNGNISGCCNGRYKSAGNYLWLYETDYLNGKRPDENNLINGHSKPILQFAKNNDFVKRYNSIREAKRETGLSNISQCCLGKLKSAGGYIWQYETDYLNGKRPDGNNLINGQSKPILQFTKNNEFVAKFNSMVEAVKETGISNGNISNCCSGKRKTAGGYHWKFSEN